MQIKEKIITGEEEKKSEIYHQMLNTIHSVWLKIEESIQQEETKTGLEEFLPHNN